MLSLMWGAGKPALYLHENLADETHRRLPDLFGAIGLNYHRHVAMMVGAGHRAVKRHRGDPRYSALPDDYFEAGVGIDTPILFVTGDRNRVFSDSNIRCYEKLKERGATHHRLRVFPEYVHQDLFMGKHADRDIFPQLLAFIRDQQGRTTEVTLA